MGISNNNNNNFINSNEIHKTYARYVRELIHDHTCILRQHYKVNLRDLQHQLGKEVNTIII